MAKRPISELLLRRSARLLLTIGLLFAGLIIVQASVFAIVIGLVWGESFESWLPELLIASAFLLAGGVLALIIIAQQQRRIGHQIGSAVDREIQALNVARDHANALKALAAAIGSARDMDGLFDVTLDVYQLALNDFGVPPEKQASAIFLLEEERLLAVAARGMAEQDQAARLDRRLGIIGRTLIQAELLVSDRPDQDPALSSTPWLTDYEQVICVPLCTTHGLYGLVLLAVNELPGLSDDDASLLVAIADQVAMALHNFQAYQNLKLTRIEYLAAEEDERRLVRRALHEGPSRRVAAVALRLGLIRTMMLRDPDQASLELHKMETQTRQSSQELRNIVTYLRPLNLRVTNLNRAVDVLLQKLEDLLEIELRVGQRAGGEGLSEQSRAVILYVLEGSLVWAGKYGQATAAEIHLWQKGDRFYISIDDDGYARRDGQAGAVSRSDDLATELMLARVSRAGGRLELTPKPGRGVTTLLTLPLGTSGPAA